jgi:hypothetical protein
MTDQDKRDYDALIEDLCDAINEGAGDLAKACLEAISTLLKERDAPIDREVKWAKWPQGDAGDAIDYACDHIMSGSFEAMQFLEQWREGRANERRDYVHWLKVQRDGARAALSTTRAID